MEEAQIPATETAVEAPVTTEVETSPVESGTTETVVETDEQKEAKRLIDEKQRGERAKRSIQKRFGEYSEALKQKDRQIEQLMPAVVGTQQQPEASTDAPPGREEFATYEDDVEARAEYRAAKAAESRLMALVEEAQKQQQTLTKQQEETQAQKSYAQALSSFEKTTPDFREVVDRDDVSIPDDAVRALYRLPDPGPVLYAIGKNPELASSLWQHQGNAVMQSYLLGQIAASAKSAPQISNAPPPGKPVGAKGGSSSDPPKNPDAYMAWRKKNLR